MAEGISSVRLGDIIQEFGLEVLNKGTNYENVPLRTVDVNRPGLPLTGFFEHFDTARLLLIGLTEYTYLRHWSRRSGENALRRCCLTRSPA